MLQVKEVSHRTLDIDLYEFTYIKAQEGQIYKF